MSQAPGEDGPSSAGVVFRLEESADNRLPGSPDRRQTTNTQTSPGVAGWLRPPTQAHTSSVPERRRQQPGAHSKTADTCERNTTPSCCGPIKGSESFLPRVIVRNPHRSSFLGITKNAAGDNARSGLNHPSAEVATHGRGRGSRTCRRTCVGT